MVYLHERLASGGPPSSDRAWADLIARGAQWGLSQSDVVEIVGETVSVSPGERTQRRQCPGCGDEVRGDPVPDHCPSCQIALVRCVSCRMVHHAFDADRCRNPRCPGPPLDRNEPWTTFRGDASRGGRGPAGLGIPLQSVFARDLGAPMRASPISAVGLVVAATMGGVLLVVDRAGNVYRSGSSAWPLAMGGAGFASTPAYSNGRIAAASLDGRFTIAELASGSIVAEAEGLGPIDASVLWPNDAGPIILATEAGILHGLDPATAKPRWSFPSGGDRSFTGAFRASPAYADGVLVVSTEGGEIAALDLAGARIKERWRAWAPAPVYSTPILIKGFACIVTKSGEVLTYRLGDGRLHARGGSPGTFVVSSPALWGQYLVFGGADGTLHAVDYLSGVQAPGFPLRVDDGVAIVSSPAVSGNQAFIGTDSGILAAIDLAKAEVVWQMALGASIRSSPAIVGANLYVGTDAGVLHAFTTWKD